MSPRTKLSLIAAAALVAAPQIASAAVVIVRSAGAAAKAYPPGKTLPESMTIRLGNGDMVTVLGPGSARVLRGPGVFPAGQQGRESLALAAGRRSRFGALRTGDVAQNPSLWDLDVTQSGKMCVADGAKLTLWRPNADSSAKISIRSSDGKVRTLDWAAGKSTTAWPAPLPVTTGTEYVIEWPGTSDKSNVNFVAVPKAPSDLVGAAQLLIQNGCENQLDLLVENASKGSE
jgi:hypothetical protein